MAERQIGYRKVSLVLSARFPVVKLRPRSVAKSAYLKAGGFWSWGVTAFFDARVTHVHSKCNQGKASSTIFKEQEVQKKRKYQQRVLDVEMGSFTPLVFGTNGGMGADCNCFLKRLAEKLSEKNEEPYHITITWIRTLLSFEILRSVHTCVRGSKIPFHKIPQGDFIDDCG